MTKPDHRTPDSMSLTQKQSEGNSANGFRTLLQKLQSNCSAPLLVLYLLLALQGLNTAVSHQLVRQKRQKLIII